MRLRGIGRNLQRAGRLSDGDEYTRDLIETLRRSETFDAYGHAFAETTGMPVTLRPIATKRLPFRGSAKENAFCAIMAEKEDTCAACRRLQERLAMEATDQPATRDLKVESR